MFYSEMDEHFIILMLYVLYIADNCKQMSSFAEGKADDLVTDSPMEYIKHNQFQLSRIYPSGRRTDSSNYNPVPFWNAGCQVGEWQKPDIIFCPIY